MGSQDEKAGSFLLFFALFWFPAGVEGDDVFFPSLLVRLKNYADYFLFFLSFPFTLIVFFVFPFLV